MLGVSNRQVMVDRPARLTSSGISVTRGRSRFQEGRFQGQVYHMTQEDVGVMPDVVAGTVISHIGG